MAKTTLNDKVRPDNNKMYPFEWIYWDLMDMGEFKMAEAVRWLISSRNEALESADWQASRRYEVEHKETK